jgi:hypothetical protein
MFAPTQSTLELKRLFLVPENVIIKKGQKTSCLATSAHEKLTEKMCYTAGIAKEVNFITN